jgi:hypothetical protein
LSPGNQWCLGLGLGYMALIHVHASVADTA